MHTASATAAILALSVILAGQLHAQEADQAARVARALDALDAANQDEAWQFTLNVAENDEQRVIRHDPRKALYDQRTLLSIDGQPPNAERLEDFTEQEKKRIDERDPEANYRYLVDLETLSQVATEGNNTRYTFTPRLKQMEKAQDKMRGELLFNSQAGAIDMISINSIEAFSPAFSVTLESYLLEFRFRDEDGTRLLDSMQSSAVGKAGFVKKFDTQVDVQFSDYAPINP